jgi:O-methyltransferase
MLKLIKSFARSLFRGQLDDNSRFEILMILGRFIFPKYRFKWYQMAWWSDEPFNQYLSRFSELNRPNTDRRWMLYQLLRLTQKVPGDTAECGVHLGSSSFLICQSNQQSGLNKTHHGFDSFEGLSKPTAEDGSYWKSGDLSVPVDVTKKNLSDFKNVKLYQGWIPTRFKEVEQNKFSFVHVDVDILEPTRDSIEFFYPRLSNGGVFLCDDYGFTSCPGVTKTLDEFLKDKPEKMISLPDGGGFFIKGHIV